MKLNSNEEEMVREWRKPVDMKWIALTGIMLPTLLLVFEYGSFSAWIIVGTVMWTFSAAYFMGWLKLVKRRS